MRAGPDAGELDDLQPGQGSCADHRPTLCDGDRLLRSGEMHRRVPARALVYISRHAGAPVHPASPRFVEGGNGPADCSPANAPVMPGG